MKNTLHILTGLALAFTLAACGKKEESKAEAAAAAPTPAPAAAPAVPAGDLEEIKLEFPKPMFIGTPVPAELPNLEKADPSKVVKSIMVPKGTTNLAKGKKVTSSDSAPIIGELSLVTDGDADGADGSFVELMPGKQWVQIDLGEEANIYKIAMWHYHKQAQAYIDVEVQVSDDPEFKTGVTSLWNSDHDDSSGMGKGSDPAYVETNHGRVVDAKGIKARYVRLWSNGNTSNDMNHYCEVEVFGKPAK
ncbi:discoidin domain-containing protein [Prosthecobacter sp.]|uniref:discoidin domain-containing protein n=1 Tax=Prosthecobacter sp. TaxID=1965333 RepID=UPI003783C08E